MGDVHPTEIIQKNAFAGVPQSVFCIIKYAYQLSKLVQSRSA